MHNAPKDSPPKAEYGLWQQLQNAKCVLCLFDGVVTGQSLFQEGTRRTDMIRFGTYNGTWWEKPASDSYVNIFPIPQTQIDASNGTLTQNPGY